jgi:hypothetical protein
MPKIPLYNQGAGPTVGVAAGQLSPRASAAAFTAPGKALAGYQKTFSDIGSVAQQFALAEKDAQTRQAISDVTVGQHFLCQKMFFDSQPELCQAR